MDRDLTSRYFFGIDDQPGSGGGQAPAWSVLPIVDAFPIILEILEIIVYPSAIHTSHQLFIYMYIVWNKILVWFLYFPDYIYQP